MKNIHILQQKDNHTNGGMVEVKEIVIEQNLRAAQVSIQILPPNHIRLEVKILISVQILPSNQVTVQI